MRKILFTSLLLLMSFNFIFAQELESQARDAKFVIVREDIQIGSAINYNILANDEEIIRLRNNSYYEYYAPAGRYSFSIKEYQKGNPLNFYAEEDKTYYIFFLMKQGFWSATPDLILVDANSALPILENMKIRKIENEFSQFIRPKNSIGLTFVGGFGTRSEEIYEMDNGKTTSFSFGGGFGLGLNYAYEFSRFFDVQAGINFQSSELRPAVKNAKWSFNRASASLTPHFIIPIKDGETMRFKLGAGADFYFWNRFKVDDDFHSIKTTNNYKNTIGYNAELLFDMNLQQNWSIVYGFRWTGVKFELPNVAQSVPDDFMVRPDGNGLNLVMKMNYHF